MMPYFDFAEEENQLLVHSGSQTLPDKVLEGCFQTVSSSSTSKKNDPQTSLVVENYI